MRYFKIIGLKTAWRRLGLARFKMTRMAQLRLFFVIREATTNS